MHPPPLTTNKEPGNPTAVQPASGLSAAGDHPCQVLLVDDSPIVCGRLSALINQLHRPIRVAVAADGVEATQLFIQLHPAAVVLDLELPGESGFDLLAQFKLRNPACMVIVLTTYAYPEFRENALRLGADHFFSKAMEFERVTEVLSALVPPSPQ